MAQAATMGPPMSPRETRRSGRRSAPSTSNSTSKSPDSDQGPGQKDNTQRQASSSNNSNGRNKRLKQEDLEDGVDERRPTTAPLNPSIGSSQGTVNGKSKRKTKDQDKSLAAVDANEDASSVLADDQTLDAPEEEEQGITRCVCGSSEDDPDAGEFMVQCETCKVWQHGLCMGYQSEDQVHDDDYYCEQCRPELHTELLKKLSKRPRQLSATHHAPAPSVSRVSRSHSPSHHLKQQSKRRNTMNSRDAAFDESLKEIIEATAAEAAAVQDITSSVSADHINPEIEEELDPGLGSRKKRKRTEDDTAPKKRTRSASSASDRQGSIPGRPDTPASGVPSKASTQAPLPKPPGRNKRGGRKAPAVDVVLPVEVDDLSAARRQGSNSRAKGTNTTKRPPLSHLASHGASSVNHEHGTRRNQTGNVNVQHTGPGTMESARAYRNSHAYAVSQQPLFTSWNLPDYLSHLEEMLPSDTPQPLEVRAGMAVNGNPRGDSPERMVERGVKVKWPSKRMSVGDMNKRVRALVEWVGREQATALDRERRRDALEKALDERGEDEALNVEMSSVPNARAIAAEDAAAMNHDLTVQDKPRLVSLVNSQIRPPGTTSTMKLMEELMEELIRFQERFGPGARTRERERRQPGNS